MPPNCSPQCQNTLLLISRLRCNTISNTQVVLSERVLISDRAMSYQLTLIVVRAVTKNTQHPHTGVKQRVHTSV